MKEYRKKHSKFENDKIFQSLNPNKAHGNDNVSVLMLEIYGSTIYRPLETIFKEA